MYDKNKLKIESLNRDSQREEEGGPVWIHCTPSSSHPVFSHTCGHTAPAFTSFRLQVSVCKCFSLRTQIRNYEVGSSETLKKERDKGRKGGREESIRTRSAIPIKSFSCVLNGTSSFQAQLLPCQERMSFLQLITFADNA